ncbi:hypothetical protein P43SY_010219 [Pythium insidiosum]|uniref:Uncharacterized protein n=1 Tax=Pythium insidiosum TaxID=114742 RepID=A0AAD5L8K1_PYTIN|nr:hypothetical protein P43SY_010219 [Pythium insidiosum]
MDEATQALDLFLRVHPASTLASVHYGEFLGILRDCYNQARAAPSSPPASPAHGKSPSSPISSSPPLPTTDVAEYLIHHATETERQHFESLMDALHRLHQRVQRSASQSTPPASTLSSGGHEAIKDQDQETAVAIGELTAIENGVCLPLGPRLQVRVQFTTQ